MWKSLRVKYQLFLADFGETWILSTVFRQQKLKYKISSTSVQWEHNCFMQMDGRTDMKLIVTFPNFANAPNKRLFSTNVFGVLNCPQRTPFWHMLLSWLWKDTNIRKHFNEHKGKQNGKGHGVVAMSVWNVLSHLIWQGKNCAIVMNKGINPITTKDGNDAHMWVNKAHCLHLAVTHHSQFNSRHACTR
jgi:hypothetical protein